MYMEEELRDAQDEFALARKLFTNAVGSEAVDAALTRLNEAETDLNHVLRKIRLYEVTRSV